MRYPIEDLRRFGELVLTAAGMSQKDAAVCTDCLLAADMRGVHSHGMIHLKDLVNRISCGTIDPRAKVELVQAAPAIIRIDGHHCAGMVSGRKAMERCVELARSTGVALASICNANTYGLGAYYPLYATQNGMIGFAVCNTKAYVAPWGGSESVLGTNPLSVALPAGKYPDFVIDMATSQSAVNKIALAVKEGRSIPEDWAVGPDGERTTDPTKAYQGALLPFGGYKGYALQLLISVLAYGLAGGDMDRDIPKAWVDADQMCNFGCLMGAIDISKFLPVEEFKGKADSLFDVIKSGRAAEWSNGIRIPGENAAANIQTALTQGIELSDVVMDELRQLGESFHIALSFT